MICDFVTALIASIHIPMKGEYKKTGLPFMKSYLLVTLCNCRMFKQLSLVNILSIL